MWLGARSLRFFYFPLIRSASTQRDKKKEDVEEEEKTFNS